MTFITVIETFTFAETITWRHFRAKLKHLLLTQLTPDTTAVTKSNFNY